MTTIWDGYGMALVAAGTVVIVVVLAGVLIYALVDHITYCLTGSGGRKHERN